MKKLLLAIALLGAFASIAHARNFAVPTKDPAVVRR